MNNALTDVSVMITRCARRSLRDPEAFFTALMLPIILMLLFVYVFGGAMSSQATSTSQYVNYVVPGLIVLCAGFGAGTTAVAVATDMSSGIVDRFRSMHWLAAAGMIITFILAISWLAAAAGLLVKTPEAANSVTFVIMFLPYLSTAFVPARTMTPVLRPIAANQPFTPVIETMRGLWTGRTATGAPLGHEALLAVAYCTVILAASAASASYLFRRRSA
jgi:ABC-2 type transport system permease protein